MTDPDAQSAAGQDALPWYVYDRHGNLLHIATSLQEAEEWAAQHWDVAEVADREVVAENDYYYLLLATNPSPGNFHSRDFQARIIRQDRVEAIGRDPHATPRRLG